MWAETNQCIFYAEGKEVAVADHFIASYSTVYQQVLGKSLTMGKALSHLPQVIADRNSKHALEAKGLKADEKCDVPVIEMIWPYDDRGRLVGEAVWEPEPSHAELTKLTPTKLTPAEVVTVQQAAEKLNPLIKSLSYRHDWQSSTPSRGLLSLNCFLSLPETVLGSRMAHRKQKTRQAWIIREPVQPGFFLNPEAKYIYLWSLQRAATFAHHNKLSERRFLEDAARIFEETGSYRLAESLPPEWFQRSKNGHNTSHYRPRE